MCKGYLFTFLASGFTFNFELMNTNVFVQVVLNVHRLFISKCDGAVTKKRKEKLPLGILSPG